MITSVQAVLEVMSRVIPVKFASEPTLLANAPLAKVKLIPVSNWPALEGLGCKFVNWAVSNPLAKVKPACAETGFPPPVPEAVNNDEG
jgi:hypothetical protein